MSPDSTMESTLPSTNSSLFNVPKLAEDGSNWITYKERTLTAIGARGLMRHIDGRAIELISFDVDKTTKVVTKKDGTPATQTEIDELDKKIDEYYQKNSLVKQQIFSTITDRLLLRVQKLKDASEIWKEICQIHEGKTELVQIDLRWRLQETRCDEGGDVKAHFAELLRLRESLAGMGVVLVDTDFHAIILGSLPESYRPLLSSISAAAKITKSPLTPNELISIITEEFEHRQLTEQRPSKKGKDVALSAVKSGQEHSRTPNQKNQDITCFNCERKGHYKTNCWRPGGGKEGQGPHQK
jgi:hypothetical protein